jgi:P27 family predicted phage terminase small subunit
MAGRKRKPHHLHIVQGTIRPCRINKSEPKAPDEPPRAAVELDSRPAFWFGVVVGRLQGMGIASSADSEEVMLLAKRLAEIEECDVSIKEHGRVAVKIELITLPSGEVKAQKTLKANPAVAQRSEAMRHAQSLLAEFGLSPASRGKVSAQSKGAENANPWESLVNG